MNKKKVHSVILARGGSKGIRNKKSVIYTPSRWRVVMMVVRNLPEFIFNKLNIYNAITVLPTPHPAHIIPPPPVFKFIFFIYEPTIGF